MSQNNPIVLVAESALELKEKVKKLLSEPEYQTILLMVESKITGIVNALNHISGQPPVEGSTTDQFPPITNFMGEKIHEQLKVKGEDLTPKDSEKNKFKNRVRNLYEQFPSLSNEAILNSHTQDIDIKVLRGVAKMAKLENFADAEINDAFIVEIRESMKALDEVKKTEEIISKNATSQKDKENTSK